MCVLGMEGSERKCAPPRIISGTALGAFAGKDVVSARNNNLLMIRSNSAVVARAPLTPAARVRSPLRARFVEIYFSPLNTGECASLVARMIT